MAGKKKFEPERIAAALKLLRALPVKDNRKTTGETLNMLKGGIQEALDKGYDRTEIRALIAPEVPVSATTFNDFLAANLTVDTPQTGKEADAKRKSGKDTTPMEPEQTAKVPTMKPESPVAAERKPAPTENGNPESGQRNSPDSEPPQPKSPVKDTTPMEPEPTGNGTSMKPKSPVAAERQPDASENGGAESVNRETPTIETRANAPAHKTEPRKMPSYYTPDLPDSEL